MIIQVVLVLGLLSCLFYAFLQRGKSKLVSLAIAATGIAGIYFVLFPHTPRSWRTFWASAAAPISYSTAGSSSRWWCR